MRSEHLPAGARLTDMFTGEELGTVDDLHSFPPHARRLPGPLAARDAVTLLAGKHAVIYGAGAIGSAVARLDISFNPIGADDVQGTPMVEMDVGRLHAADRGAVARSS